MVITHSQLNICLFKCLDYPINYLSTHKSILSNDSPLEHLLHFLSFIRVVAGFVHEEID